MYDIGALYIYSIHTNVYVYTRQEYVASNLSRAVPFFIFKQKNKNIIVGRWEGWGG